VEYTFTDISPLFLNKAQQKFAAYDFVSYRTLDIAQDPAVQGFESHCYDLILATNVLHATSDLRETVRRVHQLLVPGGLLLAVEGTRKQRFADIIVGLTPGWWVFSDKDLRPSYALVTQPQWLKLFEETGFVSAQGLTGQAAMSNQSLLIAQAGESVPLNTRTWLVFTENNLLINWLKDCVQDQTVSLVQQGDTSSNGAALSSCPTRSGFPQTNRPLNS
jgi:SAM-dependent methyltransferase